jgi:hypothetical protein
MLDLAITWLPLIGALVLGSAVTVWYGIGSKNVAIWTGFAGAVILALGFSLHLQKVVADADVKPAGPTDAEIASQRAYVTVKEMSARIDRENNNVRAVYFRAIWENGGNTPARNARQSIAMKGFDPDMPPDFDYAENELPDMAIVTGIRVIGARATMKTDEIPLPGALLPLIQAKKGKVYLWGWLNMTTCSRTHSAIEPNSRHS